MPAVRLRPAKAFLHAEIDYAEPITLNTFQGQGTKTYEGWIAVFVCLTTSAIYIEIVIDHYTDAFVVAFQRFTSRRGACSILYLDCSTNFIEADASLKKEFAAGSRQLCKLQYLLATDGTHWKFNPPSTPHPDGQFHLITIIRESLLAYT